MHIFAIPYATEEADDQSDRCRYERQEQTSDGRHNGPELKREPYSDPCRYRGIYRDITDNMQKRYVIDESERHRHPEKTDAETRQQGYDGIHTNLLNGYL